ncbi:MAG: hypothetical protein R6U61_04280 [Thermoplasmata archaeon]
MKWTKFKPKLKGWMKEEDVDSTEVIDDEWEVEEVDDGSLKAKCYRTPFVLYIEHIKKSESEDGYIKLKLYTNINTAILEPNLKVYLYRKMLKYHADELLIKYSMDSDDVAMEPLIGSDLDLTSINKEEFNDALMNLLTASFRFFDSVLTKEKLFEMLGGEFVWSDYYMYTIGSSLLEEIQSGKISREKAVKRLVNKLEFDEEGAEDLLDIIKESRESRDMEELAREIHKRGPPKNLY